MVKLKKVLAVTLGAALMVGSLAGCGNNSSKSADGGFDAAQDISVVSREEGSGTRGAFVELTGVEEKDADGNKVDNTTTNAITCNSTEVVLTTVAGDDYAIGYISLGALNDTVKALKIGGVEASEQWFIHTFKTFQHRYKGWHQRCCTGFHQLHHERGWTEDHLSK